MLRTRRIPFALPTLSALLLALVPLVGEAAATPTPHVPGDVKSFGDWIAGCDNTRHCTVIALGAEGAPPTALVRVTRDGARASEPVLTVSAADNDALVTDLLLDGSPADVTIPRGFDSFILNGAKARTLLVAFARSQELTVDDDAGGSAAISLAGLSDALRFVDETQRRVDTKTAIIARGAKPASAVPGAPGVPNVASKSLPSAKPARLTPEQVRAVAAFTGCDGEGGKSDGAGTDVELTSLGKDRSLLLWPCGDAATLAPVGLPQTPATTTTSTTTSTSPDTPTTAPGTTGSSPALEAASAGDKLVGERSAPVVLIGKGVATEIAWASFQAPVLAPDGHPTVVDAVWDPRTGTLSHTAANATGECGANRTWVWSGEQFRLLDADEMPVCRGLTEWITTFRGEAHAP